LIDEQFLLIVVLTAMLWLTESVQYLLKLHLLLMMAEYIYHVLFFLGFNLEFLFGTIEGCQIGRRRTLHMQKYPDAKVISLGIGDTTEPIPRVITAAMEEKARALSTLEGYTGYGAEQGETALRAGLATAFYGGVDVNANEIFVSDGAKCDIARLQVWAQFCLNKVPLSVDI
jgi:hypothetical protein